MDLAVPKIPSEMLAVALNDAAHIELDPSRADFESELVGVLGKVFEHPGQRAAFFESVSRHWEQAEGEDTRTYTAAPGALRLDPSREYSDDLDTIEPTGWDGDRDATTGTTETQHHDQTAEAAKFTVLVVDDSKSYVVTTANELRVSGFKVLTAMNCWDALQAFDQNKIDVMLLDVSMPRMDGIELLEVIHRRPYGRQVPALMITSDATPRVWERATAAGASGVIAKPATITTLVRRITELASGLDAVTPLRDALSKQMRER